MTKLFNIFIICCILNVNSQELENSFENKRIELKEFVEKIWPNNFKNLFENIKNKFDDKLAQFKNYSNEIDKNITDNSAKKDFLKKISKTVEKVENYYLKSTKSTGLDANETLHDGIFEHFKASLKLIYPGTKWCGDGDKARSYDDLGVLKGVDFCCRDHDNCPLSVSAGQTQFGLENTGLFTRSHCDCDEQFHQCLKNTTSIAAKNIGVTYFTILGPQCFKKTNLITDCVEYSRGKCILYEFDRNSSEEYQWFDNPRF